jgi:hypothetical protein
MQMFRWRWECFAASRGSMMQQGPPSGGAVTFHLWINFCVQQEANSAVRDKKRK